MTADLDHRKGFVKRMVEACDRSSIIPQPNFGRQVFIAQRLGVSNESVNKWFKATAMPRPQKMKELAKLLGVDEAWLSLGTSPEIDRKKRIIHGRNTDGAAQLVFGMMTLAGVHCGEPSENDPRRGFVDFYAMAGVTVYPIRVTLGVKTAEGEYEFFVDSEFRQVRLIGVINLGQGKFHFLDLDLAHVEQFKVEQPPSYRVVVRYDHANSRYQTEKYTWPRIHSFEEFA